jgi:2'-5' RNA ligase
VYRLFAAIDLPAYHKERLLNLCFGLPGAKWVDETRMHLTLRFIGEVDGAVFQDIQETLATVEAAPFEIEVKGVGFFPPRNHPETLWAGVEKSEPLIHLQKRIEAALQRIGVPAEKRKFAPHIQLARIKDTPAERVAGFLSDCALLRLEPFEVVEFCLYSSFLSSERALHQIEATFPLTGKGGSLV